MGHRHGLAGVVAAGLMAWSPTAWAGGMGGAVSAVSAARVAYALAIIFGISLVGVLSLRAAAAAFGRMRTNHPGRGLQVAQVIATVSFAVSVASTIVSGGLLFALFLLM